MWAGSEEGPALRKHGRKTDAGPANPTVTLQGHQLMGQPSLLLPAYPSVIPFLSLSELPHYSASLNTTPILLLSPILSFCPFPPTPYSPNLPFEADSCQGWGASQFLVCCVTLSPFLPSLCLSHHLQVSVPSWGSLESGWSRRHGGGGAGRFRGQEKGLSMGQGLLVCYSPRASSPATGRAGFLQQERD